jgi:hypothetical protein
LNTTNQLVFRKRLSGSSGVFIQNCAGHLGELLEQTDVRTNTSVKQPENQKHKADYNQVLQSASLFPKLPLVVTTSAAGGNVRNVIGAAARRGIARTPARRRFSISSIDASRRKALTVHCLLQDARDLLGECSMFSRGSAAQAFFQMVWDVCANKDSFAICHFPRPLLNSLVKLA